MTLAAVSVWFGLGLILPILAIRQTDKITIADVGRLIACVLMGPIVLLFFLFDEGEGGAGSHVIWTRKPRKL